MLLGTWPQGQVGIRVATGKPHAGQSKPQEEGPFKVFFTSSRNAKTSLAACHRNLRL